MKKCTDLLTKLLLLEDQKDGVKQFNVFGEVIELSIALAEP